MHSQLFTWQASLALEIRNDEVIKNYLAGAFIFFRRAVSLSPALGSLEKTSLGKTITHSPQEPPPPQVPMNQRNKTKSTLDLNIVALGNLQHVFLHITLHLDLFSLSRLEGELHYRLRTSIRPTSEISSGVVEASSVLHKGRGNSSDGLHDKFQ